jgi:hypothetical protein
MLHFGHNNPQQIEPLLMRINDLPTFERISSSIAMSNE